jgi:hypothetical protein
MRETKKEITAQNKVFRLRIGWLWHSLVFVWHLLMDARTTAWLTLVFATVGLYLAIYGIHKSRDIALEIEEQRMVSLMAAKTPVFLEDPAGHTDWFEEYKDAHWDLRLHRLLKDDWLTELLMHGRIKPTSDAELEGLTVLSEFYRREAQNRFEQTAPLHLKRIADNSDTSIGANQLARFMVVGYYIGRFNTWKEGKEVCLKVETDPAQQAKLRLLFQRIENTQ